jgi:hypothetical protein
LKCVLFLTIIHLLCLSHIIIFIFMDLNEGDIKIGITCIFISGSF